VLRALRGGVGSAVLVCSAYPTVCFIFYAQVREECGNLAPNHLSRSCDPPSAPIHYSDEPEESDYFRFTRRLVLCAIGIGRVVYECD